MNSAQFQQLMALNWRAMADLNDALATCAVPDFSHDIVPPLRVTAKLQNGTEVHVACKAERDDRTLIRFRCGNCGEAVLYKAGDVCAWCNAVAS